MKPASVLGALLLALTALLTAPAGAQSLAVSEHTLNNGLKILIHEDHDIPNVAMYFFFRVGSRNERPGITGISHFFEHMMFNGAKKYGPKQFDKVMDAHGGYNNAYTNKNVTVYQDWFPKDALELIMDLESDRIRDLRLDPKIIESERGVVANERRMSVDNSNFGALYEQMNAAAFTAHPYQWPVIGWPSDIQAWTLADLKHHFRMGYAPNNCTLVVAGDVTAAEVVRLAKKYLEPIPRHDPPPPVKTVEPAQQGERRVELCRPAQLPIILAAYHVPESKAPDNQAIEVLGTILTEGRSSRLYRRLVDREELLLSVDYDHSLALNPGLLFFVLRPRSGIDEATAEKVFYEELEKVRSQGVTEAEVRKAKNLLLVDLYRDLKTISGKANRLGEYEIFFGGYRNLSKARENLEKVTAADIKRVASAYLGKKNRTVAVLVPTKQEDAK